MAAAACAGHAGLGPASLVLYDGSTLYFETDAGDGFREPGSFRMAKSDLQARPIYHRKRDSIEAHLTIVFAALAASRWRDPDTRRLSDAMISSRRGRTGRHSPAKFRPCNATTCQYHPPRRPHRLILAPL